jgi:hypothetical protein
MGGGGLRFGENGYKKAKFFSEEKENSVVENEKCSVHLEKTEHWFLKPIPQFADQ